MIWPGYRSALRRWSGLFSMAVPAPGLLRAAFTQRVGLRFGCFWRVRAFTPLWPGSRWHLRSLPHLRQAAAKALHGGWRSGLAGWLPFACCRRSGCWMPIPLGVLLGLFFGKQLGVYGVTTLATRLGLCQLPPDLRSAHLYGGALLCGIGFTMSLFIGDLAFEGAALMTVKLGVFVASAVSALTGLLVLALVPPARRRAVDSA